MAAVAAIAVAVAAAIAAVVEAAAIAEAVVAAVIAAAVIATGAVTKTWNHKRASCGAPFFLQKKSPEASVDEDSDGVASLVCLKGRCQLTTKSDGVKWRAMFYRFAWIARLGFQQLTPRSGS